MFCPVCEAVRMKEVEKDGVLIDICPSCKGVWLDRGELDKVSSRVKEARSSYDDKYEDHDDRKMYNDDYRKGNYYDKEHYKGGYAHRKKKKSVMDMLGDLFD
ncbi:zf-TFIIB domain-containing protein [Sporolactobacillus kofuensis]|uniref:Zf-TFIIB domain-containing protein n=1 Tax=Sporolactobacillus kofuensis TaxID=269672 RepID=A0ABW1WK46_9BACL|nr:zf-TFIIB domain-containing protein [Sporolactobacillus kofuensis]MCO7176861.1 zf-TFIIB domain-containing protein [Sporolactobacillus kofuensis]